jgi:hypothetical protein
VTAAQLAHWNDDPDSLHLDETRRFDHPLAEAMLDRISRAVHTVPLLQDVIMWELAGPEAGRSS